MANYPISFLTHGFLGVSIIMLLLWLYQHHRNDASHVDIGWAIGIALLTSYYAVYGQGDPNRRFLVWILTVFWSLRLSWHLSNRHESGKEDGRYVLLRRSWGKNAQRNFFVFYIAQAILAWTFSLPSFLSTANPYPLSITDGIGLAIWLIAVAGESIADTQLNRFKSNKKNVGQTCMSGLWRYSRHPNYFFEWLYWFSFIPWAIQYSWGWVSLCFPFIMLYLLFNITGIPYTEKRAVKSRGNQYRNYQKTTNAFFPWISQKV